MLPMKYEELIVLLPCHSLEDFPVHHEGVEAEGLLAAWSALWHPALLATAGRVPTWFRADGPPDALANRLIVIPAVSESLLLAGWTTRATGEGARVVRKLHHRDEIVAACLADVEGFPPAAEIPLVADFLALGTTYLLVELLTRQMRYMSNIDEIQLRNEVMSAAQAAMANQDATARLHLQNCFEVLTEARERFYPVEAYLVDLTLVAASTLGPALDEEIAQDTPKNILISGEVLEELSQTAPHTLATLRNSLDHKTVSIVGGEYRERELPLLPLESVLGNLVHGAETYQRLLDQTPRVYGRRRFGLTPVLPQILDHLGYAGALHLTLDDGQFPQSSQAKMRWEGLEPSAIDAVCRLPLDASLAQSFLQFPRTMGESMDMDHVATVLFAHWPGQASPFLADLRRMAEYGNTLGKFITLDNYFDNTDRPSEITRFKPDQYRAPYLRQAIIRQQPDAISRRVDHLRRRTLAETADRLTVFAELLTQKLATRSNLLEQVEQADVSQDAEKFAPLDASLSIELKSAAERFGTAVAAVPVAAAPGAMLGCLVLNTESFTRRSVVDVSELSSLPDVGGPVVAAQANGDRKLALVEVPACGFAWFGSGQVSASGQSPRAAKSAKKQVPLASENVLRNEHFEVTVDPVTGGLRSIHNFTHRGNRLSQQLALRSPGPRPKPGDVWRDPDEEADYSVMAATSVEVTSAGPAFGEIVSRGNLLDRNGKRLAGFSQKLQLAAGSRMLLLEIELEVEELPRAFPWESYYAARFAWADSAAELWRSVGQTTQPTTAKRLEAPDFIEIRGEKARTTLLNGGLCYHRFNGMRMLDSLLVIRGETARKFRFGIGIDVAHPEQAALEFVNPLPATFGKKLPSAASGSSWLFHIDAKNVVATHWGAVVEADQVVGFRVRLLETEGRMGRAHLRVFRVPASARRINFHGETIAEIPVEGDRIGVDFAAYDWFELEARF
jgi:alpha-mannosidase